MQFKKLLYKWRQKRIMGNNGYAPSLKVQIGAAVIAIFLSQALLADAKDHEQKHAEHAQGQANHQAQQQAQQANHQAQQQAQQANHQAQQQAQQANHQAQQQARQNNYQAQQQAHQQQMQNQHAQNQAAHNQARNQQAQYKAAQDQFKNQNAQNADRSRERDRQANNQANDRERNAANNRANERARNEANNRTNERELNQANARNNSRYNDRNRYRHSQQANNRPGQYRRWDNGLNNRQRYQTYRKYRNNWNEQRVYLRTNMSRFNELARLNQQQQNLIDSQMRAAYLAYNNNNYNGSYNWSNYSNPQFIDYMHSNNPSLLQRILSMLGLGVEDEYLYSSDWTDERSELAQNMANIHQLAMEGRITRAQEQQLLDQLRPEFMDYHNNNYNGDIGWSQYSDPGFVDYLNRRRPSILMTVRDYLVR